MLKSVEWSPYDRMATTLIGYSFLVLAWAFGSRASTPVSNAPCLLMVRKTSFSSNFFYEALAICSAFHLGTKYACDRIAIYSDNTNTVDMFSSLRAKRVYNSILLDAVDFTM
jgi:hypothetical protein